MSDSTRLWGDIILDEEEARSGSCSSSGSSSVVSSETLYDESPLALPEDWDMEIPTLNLRKDIWTHFPVVCVPLGKNADGAELHAIQWHNKNLAAWREERTTDFFEAMDYKEITEYRLMKALQHSTKWVVESAKTAEQICVIRMTFVVEDEHHDAESVVSAVESESESDSEDEWITDTKKTPAATKLPALHKLNDIKIYYPVVWRSLGNGVYAIELFGKKIRELGLNATKVAEDLMAALKMSSAWRVLRAEAPAEFCRISCYA